MRVLLTVFVALVSLSFEASAEVSARLAKMAPPRPPVENPHPPESEQDKKRVVFAENVLKVFLVQDFQKSGIRSTMSLNPQGLRLELTDSCVSDQTCWMKAQSAQPYIENVLTQLGKIKEYRHLHIIPWSMKQKTAVQEPVDEPTKPMLAKDAMVAMEKPQLSGDEFMVHAYVQFENSSRWFHVNVIVTEDANGVLKFQRFFIMAIPYHTMPPGVVC